MGKLINILAASIGGGIVLGAGIRLGEAIASQLPMPSTDAANRLSGRLGELEGRLDALELGIPGVPIAQAPPTAATSAPPQAGSEHLRDELRGWMEENITVRMTEVESRLRADSERGQQELLDAFTNSVQTRVIQRISRLEDEVAGQSAAMSELRECSLRTELSVQKLLGALDKMIIKGPEAAAPASEPAAATAVETPRPEEKRTELLPETPLGMEPPPSLNPSEKPRRWRIFG